MGVQKDALTNRENVDVLQVHVNRQKMIASQLSVSYSSISEQLKY